MNKELAKTGCEICSNKAEYLLGKVSFCYEHLTKLELMEINANI